MTRHPRSFTFCLIVGCVGILPIAARAQEFGTPETLYSTGVEAYFQGRMAEAESAFSSLMAMDPRDPRAFYFRALALARQGRCDEARADMEIGAELESQAPNRFDIGRMLERVQGPTRLTLEQYRRRARQLTAMIPAVGIERAPDTGVLREQRVVPLDEYARPGAPQSIVAPPTAQGTVAPPARPATPPPAATPPAGTVDPFSDDTTATPAPKAKAQAPPKADAAKPASATPTLPPAPKPAAPDPKPTLKAEDDENPF